MSVLARTRAGGAFRASTTPLDDGEVVRRALCGDHDAYASLVREHQDVAFRVAYVVVGSAADAEDVVQESFVKAFRALASFRTGAPFRPWLLRIVGNEARNHRRASGRRAFHDARSTALELVRDVPTPHDEVVGRDERRRVLAALERLGERERAAIVARYLIGLTDAETAAALGVPRATVKMRAWRGLGRLRRELGEEIA